MKLIAFLNTCVQRERNQYYFPCGYANGYVAVPPEHPYHGEFYDEVPVNIHGGLTLSADAKRMSQNWKKHIESLGEDTEIPDNYWIFGFDTLHLGDNLETWSREKCIEETLRLKEQLEEMSNNKVFK